MKKLLSLFLFILLISFPVAGMIELPSPRLDGELTLEEAIFERRSVREFANIPLNLEQISQLLWAAQGITDSWRNFRSAPSAGALYPMEIFLVVGDVEDLEAGIYHYNPDEHSLDKMKEGDIRGDLSRAALGQRAVDQAPVNLIIAAEFGRTTGRYGTRGERYVYIEAGHIGQNIYLQAVALGLGTVAIGAFHDDDVAELLEIDFDPLYIFPVGYGQEIID